jgi:tetratricopeptide (TPR) repeat protein
MLKQESQATLRVRNSESGRVVWAIMGLWIAVWLPANAQQVPRAQVVEDDPPTRMEVPRAVPVAPDGGIPRAKVVQEAPAQPTAKGPDEDLFSYGTMLYERGEFGLAVRSYNSYLQTYPGGRHAATVLFRIGESLIKQGQEMEAARYYEEVVKRHPTSEGAPSAAYRLGAIAFNGRDFQASVSYFAFCEKNSKVQQVQLAAAYNMSRGYQMLGQTSKKMEALKRVIAVKEDNPYRDEALLVLAKAARDDGQVEEALKLFEELMVTAQEGPVKADAMLNAAVLWGEKGDAEQSVALFDKALLMKDTSLEGRGIALVGVVQALYDKGDYDGVIDHYNRNASVLPDGKTRGKMLLLVGNAYRMKKTYSRAVELYLMVERDFPKDDFAFEAGYWKLYCFYLLEDKDLGDFADGFLKTWSKSRAEHEFIAKAALIRADHFFNRAEYEAAAQAFADVPMDALAGSLRANALYSQGFSQVESARHQEAVTTFTRFLTENTNHEFTAEALAHRGVAYREIKDLDNAIKDFTRVTEDFNKSPAAELSWYQLGVIAGIQRNPAERVRAFENLVKQFPQSQAVPQAWFSIGSAAYELADWAKAQDALRRAIRLDPKSYLDSGSQMLILSYYGQEDAAGLSGAIDEYAGKRKDPPIPPNVLGWLGLTLFAEENFKGTVKYLKMAVTPDEPANTQSTIWNYLGMAQVETGGFKEAMVSLNHYLAVMSQPGAERGKALLYRARAELGLGDHATAVATADEALGFIKDGRLNAELLIFEGDVLFDLASRYENEGKVNQAIDEYRKAASKFIVPSQLFVDPKITPLALWKTGQALEKAGEPDRARQIREKLTKDYPSFEAGK